jgi:DNA polymerase III subunit alpha
MRDIVLKQKEAGRVVVCRGSAGGSLVCYALGISETDPIKFGLYFERFLDENRDDYADVDVDFSPDGRDGAFEDISDLGYKACRIEAHSMFTLKSAILAVARMYSISRSKLDSALGTISDSTIEEPEQIKALFNDIPDLQVARKLVGQAYTSSIHAAGVIISNEDTSFPIYYKKDNHSGKMVPTICLNKKQVEKNGYLKADLLSVRALSVIENVLKKVGLKPEVLYKLDLLDPKVFETCSKCPAGLFQLDGSIWSVYKQISGKNFDDIVSANALGRPGAFNFIPLYAKRLRHSLNRIDTVLDDTYGVCLFQEQIMSICRLFGMSWLDTHAMRRAISSSSTGKTDSIEKVKLYLAKLKELAGDEISDEQYDNIEKHGKYSFNKSHCVTYALVCYWMAWIKTYYPEKFVEEYCNMEARGSNTDWILVRRLIFELTKRGVCKKVIPLDVEQRVPFIAKNGVFTGSFLSIHGAGEKGGLSTVDALQNMGSKNLTAAKLKSIQTIARAFSTQATAQSVSLHWIPWLPVIEGSHYTGCISKWAGDTGYDGMEALAVEPIYSPRSLATAELSARKAVSFAGYATSVKRKAQTLAMPYAILNLLVENPDGQILCQVSAKNEEAYYKCVNEIKRGDFIALLGTYDGRLFRAWEVEVFRSDNFESTKTLIEENSEEEVW